MLLFWRAEGATAWELANCPGTTYWSNRVAIDRQDATIVDLSSEKRHAFSECGIGSGAIQLATFVLPTNNWFSLSGEFSYKVNVNQAP
jgi:hypothetical protein